MLPPTVQGEPSVLPNYRLYRLDGAGKITSAEWIEAPNDSAALDDAQVLSASDSFELWYKDRLIERRRSADGGALS